MEYPMKDKFPYQEIDNGALILWLLRTHKTWEELCGKYEYADPAQLMANTTTMTLLKKLCDMRDLGLISFQDEATDQGRKPVGQIKETDLWSKIRVAFGGMSMAEVAMLSRHSKGIAVVPVFGVPAQPDQKSDVFVLMPYKDKLKKVYFSHIKKTVEELGWTIRRADEKLSTGRPFMEKVWEDICAAKLVIADCTEKNPNVFYEIGIAHTIGKKVLLLTRSKKDIPSDLRHREYIEYADHPKGIASLTRKLKKILEDLKR